MNPSSEWMTRAVPALRIVSDELWTTAKARQEQTRHAVKSAGHLGRARRPQYLFSGLTKCGVCGAGFIMAGRNRLACFGARDQGRCDNLLTIRRNEVEARVLKALHEKLLRQDLSEEFCDEFTREMNRLRMEPTQGELRIELKGNLAAMLSAATNAKRSPETGDLSLQVEMVAGAGFEPATFGL